MLKWLQMEPVYIGQPVHAPQKLPPQRSALSGKLIAIIVVLVVAVLAGVGLMIANQDSSGPLSQRLVLRMEALDDILKDGKKNVSSDKLKKITAEASILLAGDMAAIETKLPSKKPKLSKSITAAEDSKPSIERLKNAKINATYDSSYASELTAKVEATRALVRELYNETRSKSFKEILNTTHLHLAQIEKDLAAAQ